MRNFVPRLNDEARDIRDPQAPHEKDPWREYYYQAESRGHVSIPRLYVLPTGSFFWR